MSAVAAPARPFAIALLVASAFFMENLDGTVIATALPEMARSFASTPVALSVGMTAYMLTLGVFIPVSGWIADRFGARPVFACAIAVFTVASILCGLSEGLWSFTAARVLQGIGGAMMVPVGRVVVLRTTAKEDLVRAIAFLTWPGLAAPVIGPPVGGFITTYFTWRWIFYLNVPIGLCGLAAALVLLPSDRPAQRRRFDAAGFLLSGAAFTSLLYGFELIGRDVASWRSSGSFAAAGVVCGVVAVWHLRRTAHPVIDLSALRLRSFAASIYGGSLFRVAISTAPFLLPLLFQQAFGLTPFASGLLVLALFAGNLLIKPVTTPLLRWFGFRTILIGNGLLNAALLLSFGFFTPATPLPMMVVVLFASGVCRSMQFTAIATLAFADVPKAEISGASTFATMIQQVSMGMGIAVGALAIHGAMALHGSATPTLLDFRWAFAITAVIAACGLADSFTLDRRAGELVSGHRDGALGRSWPRLSRRDG